MSQGCALFIFGSKGQRSGSQHIDYRKRFMSHNCFPFTLSSWNFTYRLTMSQGCTLVILGSKCQRSRSKCIYLITENSNWHIIALPLHIQSWNFTHRLHISQGYACKSVISLFKNLESLNWLPRGVFVPLGQRHSSFYAPRSNHRLFVLSVCLLSILTLAI